MLLIIIGLILAISFWASPNVRHDFQCVSPGGLIAVMLWLAASALFALYIANFSHYNKVYGSLAGIIIFLIWQPPRSPSATHPARRPAPADAACCHHVPCSPDRCPLRWADNHLAAIIIPARAAPIGI